MKEEKMEKKKTVSEIFREKNEELMEVKRENFIRTCKKEVFFSILDGFKEYFPMIVVLPSESSFYTLMRYIGIFKDKERFYYYEERKLLYMANDFNKHPYKVEKADEIDKMWKVLIILDELNGDGYFDNKRGEEILVPKDFYVFRYKAKWTAGGHEDLEWKISNQVIMANSFEEAAKSLIFDFNYGRCNYFKDFEVYLDVNWKRIKNRTSSYRIFNVSDIHEAEFVLEE